jgi:hypothetical protein
MVLHRMSAVRLLAMLILLAVFAGASYAAVRPRPQPVTVEPPRPSADIVLECPGGPTIRKARFTPVYNRVSMKRADIKA